MRLKGVKIKKRNGVGEVIAPHYEVMVNDETIVMIGLLCSGSYPGGAVWKVDQEGAEKGTSQLPHLHAWSLV